MNTSNFIEHTLDEYKADQWWVQELLGYANTGHSDADTRRAAKVASDFISLSQQDTQEYIYRFRFFQTPLHAYKHNCGWGDWEFCDEAKYNEILFYIKESDCAYQAQKIPVRPETDTRINLETKGWVEPIYRTRNPATNETVIVRKEVVYDLRQSARNRGEDLDSEVSLDNGETWETL